MANRDEKPGATASAADAGDDIERSLLIADDDQAFRIRLARAMEQRGYVVTSVGSVAEALAQTATPPAYAVIDLRLGDGNGLEIVGPLRKARPDMRIVVLTGYADVPLQKGKAAVVLQKPARDEVLIASLRKRE